MKIGYYVRTKDGKIRKISNLKVDYSSELILCEEGSIPISKHQIIKSSPNIIDLIEVGDFIGKDIVEEVKKFDDGTRVIVMADGFDEYQENEDFLEAGIVTKEQFASVEYKVVE